jgi:hypothetical protein
MTDPKPLLTREMFPTDEAFFDALIKMARTGRVRAFEPVPPRPPFGPICHKALAQLGVAPPDPSDSARPTAPTHPTGTPTGLEDPGPKLGAEHVSKMREPAGQTAGSQETTSAASTGGKVPSR